MSRLVSTLALFVLPVSTSGPVVDPPSSLKPARAPGTVHLTHEHRRVVDCRAVAEGDAPRCEAVTEMARAGTSLTVRPVDADGKLIADDARTSVPVRFDNDAGVAEATVELAPGVWTLSWSGLPEAKGRFGVGEDDDFRIGLSTQSGSCKTVERRCVLSTTEQVRRADIPPSQRVGN